LALYPVSFGSGKNKAAAGGSTKHPRLGPTFHSTPKPRGCPGSSRNIFPRGLSFLWAFGTLGGIEFSFFVLYGLLKTFLYVSGPNFLTLVCPFGAYGVLVFLFLSRGRGSLSWFALCSFFFSVKSRGGRGSFPPLASIPRSIFSSTLLGHLKNLARLKIFVPVCSEGPPCVKYIFYPPHRIYIPPASVLAFPIAPPPPWGFFKRVNKTPWVPPFF